MSFLKYFLGEICSKCTKYVCIVGPRLKETGEIKLGYVLMTQTSNAKVGSMLLGSTLQLHARHPRQELQILPQSPTLPNQRSSLRPEKMLRWPRSSSSLAGASVSRPPPSAPTSQTLRNSRSTSRSSSGGDWSVPRLTRQPRSNLTTSLKSHQTQEKRLKDTY